jgi:O-methyltransferase
MLQPLNRKFVSVDEKIYAYLLTNLPPEHAELRALREQTNKLSNAQMQITPEQGHFLALLMRLMGARRVLEIGTFTGCSALAMALALPADGHIIACDVSAEWTSIGRKYWERAGIAGKIDLRLAPALDTLKGLERQGELDSFDLAYIDADKEGYDAYYEWALRLVRPGGLIVLDNMLRRGRVADPNEGDSNTVATRKLNSKIAKDERVDRVLLPVATGMTLARRR